MVKTTAEMDGWDKDPNDPERYQVYALCEACGYWSLLQGSHETYGQVTIGKKCLECDSNRLSQQSVVSKRSFNIDRARQRTSVVKKEREKKRRY